MKKNLLIMLTALLFASCIKNDIPYPVVVPHIISMDVEGAISVTPDFEKRTVNIVLEETVDLKRVKIKSYKLDKEGVKLSEDIVGIHDLHEDMQVILTTYQNYRWTIKATRPIQYYFTVDNQVGAAVIDQVNRRVIAEVRKGVQLSNVKITSLKLGPRGRTTYIPSVESIKSFVDESGNPICVKIEAMSFEESDVWELYVNNADISVNVRNVNVWTKEVYLTADGIAGQDNGFKYREKGSGDWIKVSQSDISTDGGRFVAHIKGLKPSTKYEFWAYSGNEETEVSEFTTDPDRQFPNNSFEVYSQVYQYDFFKWYDPKGKENDCREIWWASGNGENPADPNDPKGVKGTGSLGVVLTVPDTEDKCDGNASVKCQSKNFVGLLACGNIFTGQFAGLEGTTGGSVNYGRPWTTRPHKLRVWMKYISKPIGLIKNLPIGEVVNIGDQDRCEIAISVGKWDYRKMGGVPESPVYVNTSKGTYYNSNSEGIIAFGHLVLGESTDGWVQKEIELEYRNLTEIPTHIIVTCASSYLGDYLTGADGSTLWIDKMELVYD